MTTGAAEQLLDGEAFNADLVKEAARRLDGIAHRTPVLTSTTLDGMSGAHLMLKAENLQRTGSFKFRGAYNAIASLSPQERERRRQVAFARSRTKSMATSTNRCAGPLALAGS